MGAMGADETPVQAVSRWRQPLEAVMKRILKDYQGTEPQVRDGMESGMRRLFEKPYEVEIAAMMGWKALAVEDAQRIVFFPRMSDMEVYVKAFQLDTPEATKRKEQLMKFKLLSVFYTLHRHDGGLAERFMHFGGLLSLVSLLGEENRVIQSQAIELLHDFLAPHMAMQPASSGRQAHLQHHVFLCLSSGKLWQYCGLILSEPGEVFPKSYSSSIQLLAAAIGWLRPQTGHEVAEATVPPEVKGAMTALQRCAKGSTPLAPEMRQVAEELLEELADLPTIRSDPMSGEALKKCQSNLFDPAMQKREDAAHAWQTLKLLGNEAVSAKLLWPAETIYRMALEEGGDVLPEAEASILHSNRALVLLKAGHFEDAAAAAEEALQLNGHNSKAAFRQAQALMELGSAAALQAAERAHRLEPKDAKVFQLLEKAQAKWGQSKTDLEGMD